MAYSYQEILEDHKNKMKMIVYVLISQQLRQQGFGINNFIVGWPALESENTFNSVDVYPLVNIYPVNSTVIQSNGLVQRVENLRWTIAVVYTDNQGSAEESFNKATSASRLICDLLEKYLPDSPNDTGGYCMRVDQLDSATFRQNGGTGAVSFANIQAVLGSNYEYDPVPQPPESLLYMQRASWVSSNINLTILGSGEQDTVLANSNEDSSLTSPIAPGPLDAIGIEIYSDEIVFDKGWLFDGESFITSTPDPSGVKFSFIRSDYDFTSGKTFGFLAWKENMQRFFFGTVTVTVP